MSIYENRIFYQVIAEGGWNIRFQRVYCGCYNNLTGHVQPLVRVGMVCSLDLGLKVGQIVVVVQRQVVSVEEVAAEEGLEVYGV